MQAFHVNKSTCPRFGCNCVACVSSEPWLDIGYIGLRLGNSLMQSVETTGSSESVRGGILDTIVTPPSSATLPPSELAALQVPHAARILKQSSSLFNITRATQDTHTMQAESTSHVSTGNQQMSPAAASGRQQSLNALARDAANGKPNSGLHHSPSAAVLLKPASIANGDAVGATMQIAHHDGDGAAAQPDVSGGPGSRNATSTDVGRMSSQASSTSSLRATARGSSTPQFPMTSAKALLFQASALTDYEQGEMYVY